MYRRPAGRPISSSVAADGDAPTAMVLKEIAELKEAQKALAARIEELEKDVAMMKEPSEKNHETTKKASPEPGTSGLGVATPTSEPPTPVAVVTLTRTTRSSGNVERVEESTPQPKKAKGIEETPKKAKKTIHESPSDSGESETEEVSDWKQDSDDSEIEGRVEKPTRSSGRLKEKETPKRSRPQAGSSGLRVSTRRATQKRKAESRSETPVARPKRNSGRPPMSSAEKDDDSDHPEPKKAKQSTEKPKKERKTVNASESESDSEYNEESDTEFVEKPRRSNGLYKEAARASRRRSTRNQMAVYIHSKNVAQLGKIVASHDGTVVKELRSATHFVADKLEESAEFACAVALHIPMLKSTWLTAGDAELSKQAYSEYLLRDPSVEKKLDINMELLSEKEVFPFTELKFAAETKKKEVKMLVECCQALFVEPGKLPPGGYLVTEKPDSANKKSRCVTYDKFFHAVFKQSLKSLK